MKLLQQYRFDEILTLNAQRLPYIASIEKLSVKNASHDYIKCDNLKFGRVTPYIRDIIRLCDSSDKGAIKRSFYEIEGLQLNCRSRSTLISEVTEYITQNGLKHPVKLKKSLLSNHIERKIIPPSERKYDEIIGAVFEHQHFEKAYQHIIRYHRKKKSKKIALFTTCASIKPYPLAASFTKLFGHLESNLMKNAFDKIHWLVISNATAPIPEEYHYSFPFYAYETNLAKLSKNERMKLKEVISRRLDAFLQKYKYEEYIAFLKPSSLSLNVLEETCKNNDLELTSIPSTKLKKRIIAEKGLLYWNFHGMKDNRALNELIEAILRNKG